MTEEYDWTAEVESELGNVRRDWTARVPESVSYDALMDRQSGEEGSTGEGRWRLENEVSHVGIWSPSP